MIIESLKNSEYHAHESISKSGLELVLRSPAHYKNRDAFDTTRNMIIGTATHAAILEPHIFDADYVVLQSVNDRRLKEYKNAVAERGEDFVLLGEEWRSIDGMRNSIKNNEAASAILSGQGCAELSVFTKDPETGIGVRIRPDWITNSGVMLDLKTTIDARTEHFTRSVIKYMYHMQHALYVDAWKWETGENAQFKFLAIEKSRPYANRIFCLDMMAIELGRRLYKSALRIYADCLDKDYWPAYPGDQAVIGLPEWAYNDDEIEVGA